jgi:UDP-galactopyranose mutase
MGKKREFVVVGAGLCGATAAALLTERGHKVTVFEKSGHIGGLCRDKDGYQSFGPHAFHTNDDEVADFVKDHTATRGFTLEVECLTTEPPTMQMPPRYSPQFRWYTEKAWGMKYDLLPESVRRRVPRICSDDRHGYHNAKHGFQPLNGYSAMIANMLGGCAAVYTNATSTTDALALNQETIFTGNINDLVAGRVFEWMGRTWTHIEQESDVLDGFPMIVNYSSVLVPQLRTYSNSKLGVGSYGNILSSEYFSRRGTPCYPVETHESKAEIKRISGEYAKKGIHLVGRMATYQYMDMDQSIRAVMDKLKEIGV